MANVSHLLLTRINHESKMVRKIANLFENEILTDVTLSCEGQMINAHKLILSSSSSYFQSIFQNSLIRNQINPVIIIKDMKLVDLRNIIEFIYSGEVDVSEDQLESLVKSAESLNVSGLSRVDPSRRSHLHCSHDLSLNDTLPEQGLNKMINNTQNENTPTQDKSIKKRATLKRIVRKKSKESDDEMNERSSTKRKYKPLEQKMNLEKQLSTPRYNFRIKGKDNCDGSLNGTNIMEKKNGMKPLSDNQASSSSDDISRISKRKIKGTERSKVITSPPQLSSKLDKTLKFINERCSTVASTSLASKDKKSENLNENMDVENIVHSLKGNSCDRMSFNVTEKMDTLIMKEQLNDGKKSIKRRTSIRSLKEDKTDKDKNSHINSQSKMIKKQTKASAKSTVRANINYPIIRKSHGVRTTEILKKKHGARLAAQKVKASKASLNAKKANLALTKRSNNENDLEVGLKNSTLEKIIAKVKRKRGRPKKMCPLMLK